MMKAFRLALALSLTAALSAAPGPALAQQQGEPVYNIRYYSDATYTTEVGFTQGDCFWTGPGYSYHTGEYTAYAQYELIAYCGGGYWWPIEY
ncbi:MAG TPA: hypothetical protein VMG08_10145 [Allosphingosinicella sp.]|nr:hypothetical protein [Allosphingosinicella sp.]